MSLAPLAPRTELFVFMRMLFHVIQTAFRQYFLRILMTQQSEQFLRLPTQLKQGLQSYW
jgi:hypothetical protein